MRYLYCLILISLMLPALVSGQGLSDPALQAAINATNAALPDFGRPASWEFEILLPTTDSALSCPLVPGVQLDEPHTPYIVTLYDATETPYIVHVAEDGSRAQRCDEKFPNMGMAGVSLLPEATAPDACTVTPSGPFANVRTAPNTEAVQLGTIEGSRQALGRDEGFTWYLIAEGWVAGTVVNTSGNCLSNDLSIRSEAIALSLDPAQPTAVPGALPTPVLTVTPPLSDFTCPVGFVGYLPPRIQRGEVTAQVEQGGLPNTIRGLPTTTGERIGMIQPGRRLDIVLDGPRCSDGFVWWQVEVDGVRGWTAESSFEQESYFLTPTPGNAVATTTDTPRAVIGTADGDQLAEQRSLAAGSAFALTQITAEGAFAFIREGSLVLSSYPSLDEAPQIEREAAFQSVTYGPDGRLYTGLANGELVAYDTTTGSVVLSHAAHDSPLNVIVFSPDGETVATGSGDATTDAATWTLRLWEREGLIAGEGEAVRQRSIRFPYPVTDIAFSADGAYMAVVAQQTEPEPAAALWVYAESGRGDNLRTFALPNAGTAFVVAAPTGGDFVYARANELLQLTPTSDEDRLLLARTDEATLTGAAFNPLAPTATAAVMSTNGGGLYALSAAAPARVSGGNLFGAEAVFSADGTTLVTRSTDGSVRFYSLP